MEKIYTKLRKDFGRQPLFSMTQSQLLDSISSDKHEQNKYGLRNPVHQSSQASTPQSEHDVNTKRVVSQNQGINHSEGGWPKDLQHTDEEQTTRYCKREERDDSYINAVIKTYPEFEKCLNQNNGIEVYQMYFKEIAPMTPVEKSSIRINNAYVDAHNRPVSSCAWTMENDPKLVASYCSKNFPLLKPTNEKLTCYVWDLENPNSPASKFVPPTACWQVACSPLSPRIVAGGLEDGTVCLFDLRANKLPVSKSPIHVAHCDPVASLKYMNYRYKTEFFTGSSDGQCMWWDIRDLSNPTESLFISITIPHGENPSFANSEGVSCLQFDKQLPTRFLCGTETGFVINVNKKGKTLNETMSAVYKAHNGPVKALHRSPCISKMFITCGDWCVNIWSDDILTSPIITGTPNRKQICDVVWAPRRFSSYMTVGEDGKLCYWDILRKTHKPLIEMILSKEPLLKVIPQNKGRLVAVGNARGVLTVLTLSQSLIESADSDKALMTQTYDRETHREHILENRVKEIRLKLMKTEVDEPQYNEPEGLMAEQSLIRTAEHDYRKAVHDEMRKTL